jgi:hypothetical protein
VETLPTLQHDPNRPEDVLKVDADEEGVAEMTRRMRCGIWWRRSRGVLSQGNLEGFEKSGTLAEMVGPIPFYLIVFGAKIMVIAFLSCQV